MTSALPPVSVSLPSSLSGLCGEWHLEHQENLDEFLKSIGVGWIKRKLAATIKAVTLKISITKDNNNKDNNNTKDNTTDNNNNNNNTNTNNNPYLFHISLKTPMFERDRSHPLPCSDYSILSMHGMPEDIVEARITSYLLSDSQSINDDKDNIDASESVSMNDIIIQIWTTEKEKTRNRIYLTTDGKLVMDGWRYDKKILLKRIFKKK